MNESLPPKALILCSVVMLILAIVCLLNRAYPAGMSLSLMGWVGMAAGIYWGRKTRE